MSALSVAGLLTVVCCIALSYVVEVDGATYSSLGPCPEGIAKGQTWYPESCSSCTCYSGLQQGYECRSCGVVAIDLSSPECYVAKATPHLHYPSCCDVEERCPGDPGYNASLAG